MQQNQQVTKYLWIKVLSKEKEYRHKYLIFNRSSSIHSTIGQEFSYFRQIIPYPPLRAILLKARSY